MLGVGVEIYKRLNGSFSLEGSCTGGRKYSFFLIQAKPRPDLETRRRGHSILQPCEYSLLITVRQSRMFMGIFLNLRPSDVPLCEPLPLNSALLFGLSLNEDESCMTFMVLRVSFFHYYRFFKIIN